MNTSSLDRPDFAPFGGRPAEKAPLPSILPPPAPTDFHFQTQTPRPHPMATMSKAVPAETKSATPAAVAKSKAETSAATVARDKNIELALSSITKQFGEGSIMRLGSNTKMQ